MCGLFSLRLDIGVHLQSEASERELEFGERPSWKSGALSATTREREREKNTSLWVCVCVWLEKESEREIAIVLL